MHATLYCLDLSIAAKHVIYRSVCVCVCEEVQPPERSLDFLLVVCLFIHVCRISSLFPRSEVRLRNVFPLNKKKKYNVQLVQCQLGHSSFFWTCMPALKNHLSATFFSEVGKLGCAIGSISNINVFTFLSEKHLVKVMLSGKIQNTCFKTNHSSSIFPCRRGCSWPLPSFPGWHSLAGACVCVSLVTWVWPNPLSPVLVSQSWGPSKAWRSRSAPRLRTWKVLAYFWWTLGPTKTQRKKGPTGKQEESMSERRGSDGEITRDRLIETERTNRLRRRTDDKRARWCFPAVSLMVHMELKISDTCSLFFL